MRCLQQLLVGRQRQLLFHQVLALPLMSAEGLQQELDVAVLEVVGALFDLVLVIDIAVGDAISPLQVEQALHALDVHRQPLQAVGQLA